MGIVIITIPGEAKREFVNALHKRTNQSVELVIIQKPKRLPLGKRFMRLCTRVPWYSIPKELWFGFLLRFNPKVVEALEYVRETNIHAGPGAYVPPTLEVDSVNSDEVYAVLQKISPDLLVVWGSTLLEPRILSTARKSINLHLGYCPYYRGALANQHAILCQDFSKLGATIHYISKKMDAGDVLAVIAPNISASPKTFFRELNTRAWETYLDIATRLYSGEELPVERQDMSIGKILLLKQWTPSVRYTVGARILQWESAGTP